MPVARIITSVPELSGGLVRDLNTRGFEVHIVSPAQTFSSEADLEIRIDVAGTEAITAILNTAPAETDPAEMHAPEAVPEDIWALLRDFNGDAPEASGVPAQEAVAAQSITAKQPVAAQAIITALTEQEPLTATTPATENNPEPARATETKPDENFAEIIAGPMDPELVPSMFGLANISDAAHGALATSGLHREISSASANKTWDPRSHRLAAAAAACATVVIVLSLMFAHRRAPLPAAVNSPSHDATTSMQLPFHATATASPAVMPVKAVVADDATSSVKNSQHSTAHDSDIAADTIEHFGSVVKTPPRQKQSGIRYYSDME